MRGALLVGGTASDVGKSVLVAGLCRWLHRQGVKVAPFKAQNMALNSAVTVDGAEIGRAQAAQAAAAGVEAEAAMNPVLIKPTGERVSQVVVLGRPAFDTDAASYRRRTAALRPVVLDALADLRARFDVVVCEGAGSTAEINLRGSDLANLGLARAARPCLPVVVVGDIDRGGVFAAMYGSLALLGPADQALVAGFVINRFRGDPAVLAPGLQQFEDLTGRPVLGVLPHRDGLWLDAEDSLALDNRARVCGSEAADLPEGAPAGRQAADLPDGAPAGRQAAGLPDGARISGESELGGEGLDVAAIRLPRLSNFTDLDPLLAEPGVSVRFTTSPVAVARADLVVLPGSKATVADLAWLERTGLAAALVRRARAGHPTLAICGGYQMLGRRIVDHVECRAGEVAGLGILPVETRFAPDKHLARVSGWSPLLGGVAAAGYEIRHGRTRVHGGRPLLHTADGGVEGCVDGAVVGTSWHGLLEGDAVRRALLGWVAEHRGRAWRPSGVSFAAVRERRLDRLGDLVAHHLDAARLARLIEHGPPSGLAVAPPAGAPLVASR